MKRTRRDFIGTNATAGRQRPELSVSRHCTLRNLASGSDPDCECQSADGIFRSEVPHL